MDLCPSVEKDSQEKADQVKREKLEKLVQDFICNASQTVLHCSWDYTTYERMLLHELAEKAKLGHASQGEGKKRHIVLTKERLLESNAEQQPMAAKVIKDDTNVICSTCLQKVPKANIQLHKLKCSVRVHTGAKILNLSKNSHYENPIFYKIHILKIQFFTKFTISNSHF